MSLQVDRTDRSLVLRTGARIGPWSARRLGAAILRARRERPSQPAVLDLSAMGDLDERDAFRISSAWQSADDVVLVSGEPDRTRAVLHEARPDRPTPRVFPDVAAALVALAESDDPTGPRGFRHEAFAHRGSHEFAEGVAAFIRDGLQAGESVVATLPRDRFEWVRARVGRLAERVHLVEPASLGHSPAMVVPALHDLITDLTADGASLRVVSEPTWQGARTEDLAERQRHELLLNRAFEDVDGVWLLCAYDLDLLPKRLVQHGCRSHPYVLHDGRRTRNEHHVEDDAEYRELLRDPLERPDTEPDVLHFDGATVHEVGRAVARRGAAAGLWADELRDLALAAAEVAAEGAAQGGGQGALRVWTEHGDTLVCEVADRGQVVDPLTGLVPPEDARTRHGPWTASRLCDLVQVRSDEQGTVVRLHKRGTRLRPGRDGWVES